MPIDYGIVGAAGLVPLVAFLLIGGVWADRLPRQWVMLVSDVVRFACQAVMAWLLLTHRATILELVALQFVRGSAEAFFRPAQTGLTPHTVSAERLQQANALRGLAESLGVTLGAAMGGILVAAIGSGWAIGLDSLSYLVSAGFLWGLRGLVPAASTSSGSLSAAEAGLTAGLAGGAVAPPHGESGGRTGGFLRDLRDGWQEFRSRTWLWVVVCEAAVFHLLIIAPLMVLGPYVANHSLGGAAAWGAILASLGVGQVFGGVERPASATGAAAAAVRLAHAARGAAVCLLRPRLRHAGADRRRRSVRRLGGPGQRALGDHAAGADPARGAVARVGLRPDGVAGLLPARHARRRPDRGGHRHRRLVHRGRRGDGRLGRAADRAARHQAGALSPPGAGSRAAARRDGDAAVGLEPMDAWTAARPPHRSET